jgi:hypothetical protein
MCRAYYELYFDFRYVDEIYLASKVPRLTACSTQPTIQWVPGTICVGEKRPWCQSCHSPVSIVDIAVYLPST